MSNSSSNNESSYSFVESFEVDAVLSLGELLTIVLTLNLQLFTDGLCSQVAVAGNVNDRNLCTHKCGTDTRSAVTNVLC